MHLLQRSADRQRFDLELRHLLVLHICRLDRHVVLAELGCAHRTSAVPTRVLYPSGSFVQTSSRLPYVPKKLIGSHQAPWYRQSQAFNSGTGAMGQNMVYRAPLPRQMKRGTRETMYLGNDGFPKLAGPMGVATVEGSPVRKGRHGPSMACVSFHLPGRVTLDTQTALGPFRTDSTMAS
jgi:hypothetical protein